MRKTTNIVDSQNTVRVGRRFLPSLSRPAWWIFVAIFGVLAVAEVTLYVTHNVYTKEEQVRRRRQALARELPDGLARTSDALALFDTRFSRFEKEWHEVTGVAVETLQRKPQLPPPIRDLLADPAASSAAECWDRLRVRSLTYRERDGVGARLDNIRQRAKSGDLREDDAEYLKTTLANIAEWNSAMEGHERCAQHLRDLLRARSLDPAVTPIAPPGGLP